MTKVEYIIMHLELLSTEDRLEVFDKFCTECGGEQFADGEQCQCWNDE